MAMPGAKVHEGHRKRVKDRYIEEGLTPFQIMKLSTNIIYCIPQRDTNVLAHKMINEFGASIICGGHPEDIAGVVMSI